MPSDLKWKKKEINTRREEKENRFRKNENLTSEEMILAEVFSIVIICCNFIVDQIPSIPLVEGITKFGSSTKVEWTTIGISSLSKENANGKEKY